MLKLAISRNIQQHVLKQIRINTVYSRAFCAIADNHRSLRHDHNSRNNVVVQSSDPKEYAKAGPHTTQGFRTAIAISPTCDDIWAVIDDNVSNIDISVFYTAMHRCIELSSFEELGNIYQFVLDSDLLPTNNSVSNDMIDSSRALTFNQRKKNGDAHIKLTQLLFYGLNKMNQKDLAFEWLNRVMTMPLFANNNENIDGNNNNLNDLSKANVFYYLIDLCSKNNDFEKGLKIYQWLDKLNIEKTININCCMITLYLKMNDIDTAYQFISNFENNIESYSSFLKGLIYQQVSHNDNNDSNSNNNDLSKYLISANDIDNEMIESLPNIIGDIYTRAKINVKTKGNNNNNNNKKKKKSETELSEKEFFFSIFKLLSYYGNVNECINYYEKMTSKEWNIKPNIEIYNCLIAMSLNKTVIDSFNSQKNENNETSSNDELILKMKASIERVFSIYNDLKNLFITPQISTIKLIYRAIMGETLVHLAMNSLNEKEYENGMFKLESLFEDIKNYQLYNIDKELIYYFINCHLLLSNYHNLTVSSTTANDEKIGKKKRKKKRHSNDNDRNSEEKKEENNILNNYQSCLTYLNQLFEYISFNNHEFVMINHKSSQEYEHVFWQKWSFIDEKQNLIVDLSDINDDFEDCSQFIIWYLLTLRINSQYFETFYANTGKNIVIRLPNGDEPHSQMLTEYAQNFASQLLGVSRDILTTKEAVDQQNDIVIPMDVITNRQTVQQKQKPIKFHFDNIRV